MLFGNLAKSHTLEGHGGAAKRVFCQAFNIAQETTSPWARTKALAKVAATLLTFESTAM